MEKAFPGIDQPKVSALLNGRLSDFSVDRLLRFLIVLDQTIDPRPAAVVCIATPDLKV